MSLTFTFTHASSEMSMDFFPPIELEPGEQYMIGLLAFETYNTIPNVDEKNNKFRFDGGGDKGKHLITVPVGIYEVEDIEAYLSKALKALDKDFHLTVTTNNNTLHTSIRSNVAIDFTDDDSVGRLLGYKVKSVLMPDQDHQSDSVVDLFHVSTVRVKCNLATGSYLNGQPSHIVHEFFPNVPAGYKMIEQPSPIIYLPVSVSSIDNITLRIVDQQDRLVDFRGEAVTVRLHVKKLTG